MEHWLLDPAAYRTVTRTATIDVRCGVTIFAVQGMNHPDLGAAAGNRKLRSGQRRAQNELLAVRAYSH